MDNSRNKTPEEIFNAEVLSSRFFLYQKDVSKKGRSLYLSQLLQHLKREFPEFKPHLDNAITSIRADGSFTKEQLEKRIYKALRQSATTIKEISEDIEIDWWTVRNALEQMLKDGKVKKQQHPMSDDYRDYLYFLISK